MKIKSKFILMFTSFAVIPLVISGIIMYFVNSYMVEKNSVQASTNYIGSIIWITVLIIAVISVLLSMYISGIALESMEKAFNSMDDKNIENKSEINNMSGKAKNTFVKFEDSLSLIKNASIQLEESADTLSNTSQNMVSATNGVSSSIQVITNEANFQANEINYVVGLLTTLSQSIDLVQQKLSVVNTNTRDTENKAVEGEGKIYELIDVIVKIKQSFDIVLEKVNGLSATVKEIGKITDIISSISEQTNLLALNASIEAARAGEQGRGFTVVAEEVRKLAEESKSSSEKIISLVKSITQETYEVMDNSSKVGGLLENQAVVANDTIISFEDIIVSVKHVPELIAETEDSLKEAVENNNSALTKVQKVAESAQEVSAASEEIYASSQELLGSSEEISSLSDKVNEDSTKLREKIDTFKI